MILIGYSGHAFVVYGIVLATGNKVTGYCDVIEKEYNPFKLTYYGTELSEIALAAIRLEGCFIAIGDNLLRNQIYNNLRQQNLSVASVIHPTSVIDSSVIIAAECVMIAANVTINPLATIGKGAICNTGCIIEHECVVGDFAHIGPGAVLCGNVKIGSGTFIGANAVIKQGINVGKNAMVGAGAVVVKDVADNTTVVGVPAK